MSLNDRTGAGLIHARAFAKIYATQSGRLYAYLRYRVGDAALAEDLVAEVFARAWARWDDPRAAERIVAWLFTTARNLAVDHYRQERRAPPALPLDAVPVARQPLTGSPEEGVLRDERAALLRQCLSELEAREREIVELRFVARLRNREIAPILGLSEGNVAKILHRALRKLRLRLHQGGEDHVREPVHPTEAPR